MTCFECGKELQKQEAMWYIGGDEYICEDCRDDYYLSCEDCGDLVREEDIIAIDDGARYVCELCADNYYTCDHCRGLFSGSHIAVDTRYTTLCQDCYEDHYFTCDACGEVYHVSDGEYIDYYHYCTSCADDHRTCILPYCEKPDPVFYGGEAGYGLEVEIDNGECREEAAADIQAVGGDHIYLKEDGSLSYMGIEIVTHPATLDYHVNHFPWTEICDAALSYGYRSHDTDTCGLHIHASRTLFGGTLLEQDLTIAKIMLLVDRWYDSHILRFARRDLYRMQRWAGKPNADIQPGDGDIDAIHKAKKQASDRYRAINLCNYNTIEFRFFRGTLRRDTIIACIQWVDTIIRYCRSTPLNDLFSTDWDEIFGNTGHAELTDYLKRRNLYNVKGAE